MTGATGKAQLLIQTFGATGALAIAEVPIACSIGVATRGNGEELDQLLRGADAAMYAAKVAGKGQWRVFGPELESGVAETLTLRRELQRAADRREFVVHYQPVVDLQTGAIEGVESLIRWDHPERGVLPPSEFLHEAEESGLILYIDRWVLEEACRQVQAWQKEIPAAANLCAWVNLSARQLQHPGLAEDVAEALRSSGLAPQDLILEVTETGLVGDVEAAASELERLKELGVMLALDDFGTGYSSLTHLLTFPIDIIKIDRSFVSAIGRDQERSEVALAVVRLAKGLGLRTVAEGIERDAQLAPLRSVGCEFGQGYFFAKPLDRSHLETLFTENALLA
jgi:EAL domain-containing protein (putative c-di-GMP-specific phosphodiesterase class I)